MVPIRVIIVDDQKISRLGIASMLKTAPDIELVDEASNGEIALQLVKKHQPDVVITDIEMSPMNGLVVTDRICKYYPGTAVIALSVYNDSFSVMEMLQAGAVGYLVKEVEEEVLHEAVRAAHRRQNFYSRTASQVLTALIQAGDFDPKTLEILAFTHTELRIIRMICQGMDSRQIAAKLNLGLESVRKMRQRIYENAGVDDVPGLMMFALVKGILRREFIVNSE